MDGQTKFGYHLVIFKICESEFTEGLSTGKGKGLRISILEKIQKTTICIFLFFNLKLKLICFKNKS